MTEELENSQETQQAPKQEESREGYTRQGGYQKDYHPSTGRTQRPRIHTQRTFQADHANAPKQEDGGFRPAGFGSALGGSQDHAPRTYQQGGYQQRPRYNSNQDGNGYQQRPRYNYNQDGNSYNPQQGQGGYRPQGQGGYRPQGQGGYRPQGQGGYRPQGQGGYRPRPQGQGGYKRPQGQGGYGRPQQGGYHQQRQGGYNRQGYDPNAKYSFKKRIEYKEEHVDPNEPIRLNKYLANAGVCSRREADEYIQKGEVTVNGQVVTELGTKVKRSDEVKFHDQPVTIEKKVYILLNKPKDCVTTSDDPQQRKTVMDIVKDACPERIYPVGRLDRNTTGVLLLTNDGELASKLTHPKFLKKKVYHVFLDKNVAVEDLQKIADGIELEDGEVHADAIEYADESDHSQVGIEIHSGKNRIVRRIFEHLGYHVVKLDRVQFAGLTKKNLRRGDWRFLTEQEVEMLRSGMFE
ncbi:MAG: pseudouridine synthase [Prevotella sp.]|nr:pseudouridine synthase [Prevotella sp.]